MHPQNRKYLAISIKMLLTFGIEDCALEENPCRISYPRPTQPGSSKGIKASKDQRAITEEGSSYHTYSYLTYRFS